MCAEMLMFRIQSIDSCHHVAFFLSSASVGAFQCHHWETAMTPTDANLGWQYFMNHE